MKRLRTEGAGMEHGVDLEAGRALETPRLKLLPAKAGDFADSLALWSEPQVVRHIGGQPLDGEAVWRRLLLRIGHWQALGYGYWAIFERDSGAFVGELGFADYHRHMEPPVALAPEAGWALMPAMQGRGYALEALQAALGWARQRWPQGRLSAIMEPDHALSARLATRVGFQCGERASYAGKPVDIWWLALAG
ncbi:GNAT family N-acetyltransferase [Frateuria aurantia]